MQKTFSEEMQSLWDADLKARAAVGWEACAQAATDAAASVDIPQEWASEGKVTVTMTTCRRLPLFRLTVRSLLAHCSDLRRWVDKWIVVDDNSSDADRQAMKDEFPFIEFVHKGAGQKGHAHSMNLLLKRVATRYMLHVEDDFLFLHSWDILSHALEVLAAEPNCAQVLLCANYAELPSESLILGGGTWKRLPSGRTYAVHEHTPTPRLRAQWRAKWGDRPSNSYWPHFSLRPGVWDLDKVRTVGWFDAGAAHFEHDFAQRYTDRGLVTAFLPSSTTCMHTGKHTSDVTGTNAYVLNNEPQFARPVGRHAVRRAVCINLDRRPDRWATMQQALLGSVMPVERFQAVDGQTHVLSAQEAELFVGNDYGFRRGAVACALSHMGAWKAFLELDCNHVHDWLLVLEDDTRIPDPVAFDTCVHGILADGTADNYDLVFLTTSERRNPRQSFAPAVVPMGAIGANPFAFTLGGAIAYIVSRSGIEKVTAYITAHRMTNCIDTMVLRAGADNALRIGFVVPTDRICHSPVANYDITVDSDIQHDPVPILR